MKDMEVKKQILQEIMDMMDEKESEMLKKHPKLAKVEIESNDPELAEELKDKVVEPEVSEGEEELDQETKQKLLEMYKKLK
jgi:hypothetical protein